MSAIAWMKKNAKVSTETKILGGKPFEVTTHYFIGNIPARMKHQVVKELPNLVNDDFQFERVLLGNNHKRTEYWHITYNEIVAA